MYHTFSKHAASEVGEDLFLLKNDNQLIIHEFFLC